jgi:FKBP-type peptidyl-prolyl cis-trans isomerase SlyD
MNIDNNCVVSLQFTLTDADGTEIHKTTAEDPMVYLHGWGELIDGLERALVGKGAGDELEVTVEPNDGYGDIDPALIGVHPKTDFSDVDLHVGVELQGEDEDGELRLLRIIEIDGDEVKVDMNHPLAGKTLTFAVAVGSVREATEAEIAHGHVHVDGEHHH